MCSFEAVKKQRLLGHIRRTHGEEHVPPPQRNMHHAKHKVNAAVNVLNITVLKIQVSGAHFSLLLMCKSVGQTAHPMLPVSTIE